MQQLIAVLVESNLCLLAANLDRGLGDIVNQLHGMFCLSQDIRQRILVTLEIIMCCSLESMKPTSAYELTLTVLSTRIKTQFRI